MGILLLSWLLGCVIQSGTPKTKMERIKMEKRYAIGFNSWYADKDHQTTNYLSGDFFGWRDTYMHLFTRYPTCLFSLEDAEKAIIIARKKFKQERKRQIARDKSISPDHWIAREDKEFFLVKEPRIPNNIETIFIPKVIFKTNEAFPFGRAILDIVELQNHLAANGSAGAGSTRAQLRRQLLSGAKQK